MQQQQQHHEKNEQRQQEQQGEQNPFVSDGVLSHKADYIIQHSTITRRELRIVDPDVNSADIDGVERATNGVHGESLVKRQQTHEASAAPTNGASQHDKADSAKAKRKCCTLLWLGVKKGWGDTEDGNHIFSIIVLHNYMMCPLILNWIT